MDRVVLDASAILASINEEPGYKVVDDFIEGSIISSVNFSEVVTKLTLRGTAPDEIEAALDNYPVVVEHFDHRRAIDAGLLAEKTKRRGLSLADRACLALALELKLPAVTADRAWTALDLPVKIRVIR
ncbi:MAG: type II toxin-antitoxin system VapC family toxin [Rhizobiales bacterium]|nr:type II toxin-antitoxin system VapC family toxin [Hyphomicrobiales bacterium]